jgi:hypothetical protein
MFFADLLIVLIISLVLGAILAALFGRPGWGGFVFVFLILFFATWAGGLWVMPVGVPLFGVTWLSFVLVGIFVALLLAAMAPRNADRTTRRSPAPAERPDHDSLVAVNAFFWVLISLLVLMILFAYIRTPPPVI